MMALEESSVVGKMANEGNFNYESLLEESEASLTKLCQLSRNVVEEYEKLKTLYNDNRRQYEHVSKRLQAREMLLQQLRNASTAACQEYDVLQTRLQVEQECRTEVEKYAAKVEEHNCKLKRQSNIMLMKMQELKVVDINIDNFNTEDEIPPSSSEVLMLSTLVERLKKEVIILTKEVLNSQNRELRLRRDFDCTSSELSKLQEVHKEACKNLKEEIKLLNNLKRVSILAVEEFDNLQQKYEVESKEHKNVLDMVRKIETERNILARKSFHLIATLRPDEKLIQALLDAENLTKTLEEERQQYKEEIEDLKSKQNFKTYIEYIKTLELKLNHAEEHSQNMESKYQLAENKIVSLEKTVEDLNANWNCSALRSPPPPPPPPPPPIPPVNAFNALISIIGFNKVKKARKIVAGIINESPVEDHVKKAMGEMLTSIKRGDYKLRSVSTEKWNTEPSKSAVNELKTILDKMHSRRLSDTNSENRLLKCQEEEGELIKKFNLLKLPSAATLDG